MPSRYEQAATPSTGNFFSDSMSGDASFLQAATALNTASPLGAAPPAAPTLQAPAAAAAAVAPRQPAGGAAAAVAAAILAELEAVVEEEEQRMRIMSTR